MDAVAAHHLKAVFAALFQRKMNDNPRFKHRVGSFW